MPDPSSIKTKYSALMDIQILSDFLKVYLKNGGNASKAVMEVKPEITKGSAEVFAHRYLNYIDPLKLVFPRWGKKKAMNELDITRINNMGAMASTIKKAEFLQQTFETLYEKYGGKGMKAALLAVQEMYPTYKGRKFFLNKARQFLSKSSYARDILVALEAKGVDALKVAGKIQELLDATQKETTVFPGGEMRTTEKVDSAAIDKGLAHALKVGVGGGYAPEKSLIGVKEFSLKNLLNEVEKEEAKKPDADGK